MKICYIPILVMLFMLQFSAVFAQTAVIPGKIITGDETWHGTIVIEGDITVARSGRLIILPGTRVLFKAQTDKTHSGRDKTRSELIVKGMLTARGTINNKIWFSSNKKEPRMQDWYGLVISNPKRTSLIEYAVVEYAYNGITIKRCNPQINNSQIQFNYHSGLQIELGAKPKLVGNIISENGYAGIVCNTGARPVLTDNMTTKNNIGLISFGTAEPNLGNLKHGPDYNIGRNGFFENAAFDIQNHSSRDIYAENASWGTKNLAEIKKKIFDYEDNNTYKRVDILPILGGGIDLEKKIILSQATNRQLLQNKKTVSQNTSTSEQNAVAQDSSQSTANEELALKPFVPEAKPISVSEITQKKKTLGKAETAQTAQAAVNFKQVFLDAFLDERPMVLKKIRPVVGDRQRGLKMHGKIIVRVVVDRMGHIESAKVLRGLNAYYDDLARQAALKFTFKPGTIKGNPVRFETSLFFEF